ncbi:MAG: thermonuclease family protein, partial [Thermodesulfobacteriota bacterium]
AGDLRSPGPPLNSLLLAPLLFLLGCLFWGCGPEKPGPPQEAQVSRVVDGDTLILANGTKVRLLGIDAPELEKEGRPADFLAHKARAFLSQLTQGQTVRLEYDQLRYDRYGRLLAYLLLADGSMVNVELVRQGLARVYLIPPNVRYRDTLIAAQREALEARRGIWLKALSQDEPYYLANRKTLRFHRPDCRLGQQMAKTNRLQINSLKDAYLQGYSPCRSCRP